MKVGDLAEHYSVSRLWGIVVAVNTHEYEIFWNDGDRSWISKRSMVKKRGAR